jgi:hypothetical protein
MAIFTPEGNKREAEYTTTKEPLNADIQTAARRKFARLTGASIALLTAGDVWRDVARDKWTVPIKDDAGTVQGSVSLTRREIGKEGLASG